MFSELSDFGGDHHLAVRLPWVVFEIFLMICFSFVERLEWFKLSDYRTIPDPSFRHFTDDFRCFKLLPLGMVVDYGSIIGSNVSPLPIQRCRIVNGEEDPEKVFVW